jgi:ferritin-like metal-binding protein YciE
MRSISRSQFKIQIAQQEKTLMPARNPRELFVMLLSEARQNTQLSAKIYTEISQQAQDPDIQEALEARAWIVEKDLSAIDRCFELMGDQPVQLSGHRQESLVEDFRKEIAEIQTPAAKAVFILSKAERLNHARIAEYEGLIEAADWSGHYAIGILLECCLADKLVFVERTRRFIRNLVATKVAARVGA